MSAIVLHRCAKSLFHLLTSFLPLSICAAPSREAAAKEGNYALCAIDVNPSFDPPKENGIDAADLSSLPVAAPENLERVDEDEEEMTRDELLEYLVTEEAGQPVEGTQQEAQQPPPAEVQAQLTHEARRHARAARQGGSVLLVKRVRLHAWLASASAHALTQMANADPGDGHVGSWGSSPCSTGRSGCNHPPGGVSSWQPILIHAS